MVEITKCPAGKAIGYEDDDPRLSKASREWAKKRHQDRLMDDGWRKDSAKDINQHNNDEPIDPR